MKKFVLILLFVIFSILPSNNYSLAGSDSNTCPKDSICVDNPLGAGTTPEKLIGRVINGVLGIVGSVALVMFIYGGFTWMTAAGSSEAVGKGKNIIIWAVIGLIVIFSAYAMVNFVFTDILTAPTT